MRFTRRRRSSSTSTVSTSETDSPMVDMYDSPRSAQRPRYESPPVDGKCMLLDCPEEVLVKVFQLVDRQTYTTCLRLCKPINELLMNNANLQLHYTLQCHSLSLNPNVFVASSNINLIPPAPAKLLGDLRERITRFHNFTPKSRQTIPFGEPEGRLYEFLEGILLRGVPPAGSGAAAGRVLPKNVAVYDLRRINEWEDVSTEAGTEGGAGQAPVIATQTLGQVTVIRDEEGEEEEPEDPVRTVKPFDFEVAEFAVDPGQDLLVVVEVAMSSSRGVEMTALRHHVMRFHFLSLSTNQPHPRAAIPVLEWPTALARRKISLSFQICDDGFYVLSQRTQRESQDHLCGWQWTTGRLAMTLRAPGTMSFESFILLTPWSFIVPTVVTHLDVTSPNQDNLADTSDLSWTHHLHVYAFPPLSSVTVKLGEPTPPPHTAVHVKTLDLPRFLVDINRMIPPPRLSIRADPPPRMDPPTHPVGQVAPFLPLPESGLFMVEVYCQMPDSMPHYQIILPKTTLLQYLPSPDSSLLRTAFPRPAVPVLWSDLAPRVRMWGPDLDPSSWVCYIYQNRYVASHIDEHFQTYWRIYDFDQQRTRKVINERRTSDAINPFVAPKRQPPVGVAPQRSRRLYEYDQNWPQDGERDGIYLHQKETVIKKSEPLLSEIRTGSEFPYICTERNVLDFGSSAHERSMLLDDQRIVLVKRDTEDDSDSDDEAEQVVRVRKPTMEIMEF